MDAFYEKDGRKSRYIGEVLERYRGKDVGDLIEVVEKWTCLNVLEKENFTSDPKILTEEKSWRTWKRNQKIVMDEELIQNIVMDENFVKNFVMNAKIDPEVVMVLSIFQIGGWPSNRQLLEEFTVENET